MMSDDIDTQKKKLLSVAITPLVKNPNQKPKEKKRLF